MRNVLSVAVVAIAAGATLGWGTIPALAAPSRVDVYGGWTEQVGCVPTAYEPDPADPTKAKATCVGTTTYEGGWTGQEVANAVGTIDLVSGDSNGTADATFTGTYLGDDPPSSGTLYIRDDVVDLDGKTEGFHVEGRIVGGDGAFAGSSGCVTYDGFLPGGTGHGGYSAIWFRGEPQGSAIVEEACSAARKHLHTRKQNSSAQAPVIVHGGLFDAIPCVVPASTSGYYTPNPDQPTTGTFDCSGSAGFEGAWLGEGFYHATATIDLLTNNLSGVVDLTFRGTYTGDDSHSLGTLHWLETFTFNGRTSGQHWDARIIGGTGSFAGSAGCVVGNSFEAGGAFGHGGYSGIWFRTSPGSAVVEKACSSRHGTRAARKSQRPGAARSPGASHRDTVHAISRSTSKHVLAPSSGRAAPIHSIDVETARTSARAPTVPDVSHNSVMWLFVLAVAGLAALSVLCFAPLIRSSHQ